MTQVYNISFGNSVPEMASTVRSCGWTDVKVKKAWLNSAAALSALTGIGAALAGITSVVVNGPLLLASVPFFLASGLCARYANSMIDYGDPKVLNELRREALHLSLPKIVEKHSWEKLFQYAIVSPNQFPTFYRSHADALSFSQILTFFQSADMGLNKAVQQAPLSGLNPLFYIPLPTEWTAKFKEETKFSRCDQIIHSYPLADLKKFQIVSSKKMAVLDKAAIENQKFRSRQNDLEHQFKVRTPYEHTALQNAKKLAELSYQSHPIHSLLSQIDLDETCRISSLRSSVRSQIRREEANFEKFEHQLIHHPCPHQSVGAYGTLAWRKQQNQNTIARLKTERDYAISQIQQNSALRKLPIAQSKQMALELRNMAVTKAEEDFRWATKPVRNEIDHLQALNKAEYDQSINYLDKLYRA